MVQSWAWGGGSGIPVAVVPTEQPWSLVLLTFFSLCPDLNCFVFRVLEDPGLHNARLQGNCHSLLRLSSAEVEGSCLWASLRVRCRAGVGTWQGLGFRPPQAG